MSGNRNNPKNELIDQKISSDKTLKAKSEYHDDYDQIHSAVLETKRGRWFLGEFARKNQQVESQLVLDAIAALEGKITQNSSAAAPEIKIDSAKVETAKPELTKPQAQKTEITKDDFETEQQSTHFGKLFATFKHKTMIGLKWAGIKGMLEFSKIQTIINFAAYQSRASIQTQEKKLNAIIEDLQTQNIDPIILKKLNIVASELRKLEELQGNLNVQLEDGLKFMGEVEKIVQNIEPDYEKFTPKSLENAPKTAKKQQKTAKNKQKTPENELKTLEITPKITKLGPAGRIKKMFKIEQTLEQQTAENLAEPAKAFDEAFAAERLKVEAETRSVSNAENIEKDLQPIIAKAKTIEDKTIISEQSEKLAQISDKMKQATETADQQPQIIINDDFNALNSLALLSKTERTMLFTLQN